MARMHFLATLLLVGLVATGVSAQDEDKAAKRKKGQKKGVAKYLTNQVMRPFAKVEMTNEQKEKATAIVNEHKADFAATMKEINMVMTKELKEKQKEAQKKARAEGLKGKQAREFVTKALELSEEKVKELNAARKKQTELMTKIRKSIHEKVLTDEQKPNVKLGGRGKGKGKKKKKTDDK